MNKFRILLLFATSFTPSAFAQKMDPTASREMIRQWVQTERIISEEKSEWATQKNRMQDLLDLYAKELTLLNEELEKAGTSAGMVDETKEKLETELKQFKSAQRLLREAMAKLLPRVHTLIAQLPQPLLEEIAIEIDLLQEPSALEKPRDVLKSMLALLTSAGRFNRSITVTEETRQISEGKKMTVTVLYLGLCRAYYATGSGDTAGFGSPSTSGWQWSENPDLAEDIRRAIAIYKKEKQPQLITLPINLSAHQTSE